jgi:hypothetical protein
MVIPSEAARGRMRSMNAKYLALGREMSGMYFSGVDSSAGWNGHAPSRLG